MSLSKVISLGGSIIAPDKVDSNFLLAFRAAILEYLETNSDTRLILVCGGGAPAREYQRAYRAVIPEADSYDLDWIGIAATRLNAELLKHLFRDYCLEQVITDPTAISVFPGRVLVAAATVGIVVSAARSAMSSNKDIVEVLNFVGAEERFIARQFELHFLKLGIKAGLTGAAAAALVFFLMPLVADFMSGAGAQAEFRRLFGTGHLDIYGYAALALVVVAIAAICQITSRYGVRHILNAQNQ